MTRTYGTLQFETHGVWLAKCAPHVRIRLKDVFPKVDKGSYGVVQLKHTPLVARDLEWFCQRYPLQMDAQTRAFLTASAKAHRDFTEALTETIDPNYRPPVYPLAKPLRDYQARAVDLLHRTKALLLGDDLGLGKSVSAIGTLTDPAYLPALIVCQTHLTLQWQRFFQEFLPGASTHIVKVGSPTAGKPKKPRVIPQVDVVIMSYSKLAGWADVLAPSADVPPRFRTIIFDEVQELRHSGSNKYRAALAIRKGCTAALGLSATPIYNYGGEIYNILDMINPGCLGDRAEFYREWCSSFGDKYILKEPATFGEFMRDEFLFLRRTRTDVGLELPKVAREVVTIPYDRAVLEKVKDDATELARLILAGTFEQSGQAARELDLKLRQATGVAKAPHVAQFVRMLLDSEHKVLLFGWHRAVHDVLLHQLKEFQPVLYTGSESTSQKDRSFYSFLHGSSRVMMISLRSGSGLDGLQFSGCRTCVFAELDWSPGVIDQCIGRLNRNGIEGGVLSYFLVSDGGSDPIISDILGLKREQASGIADPHLAAEPQPVESDPERVKRLARAWLTAQNLPIPERPAPDSPSPCSPLPEPANP